MQFLWGTFTWLPRQGGYDYSPVLSPQDGVNSSSRASVPRGEVFIPVPEFFPSIPYFYSRALLCGPRTDPCLFAVWAS